MKEYEEIRQYIGFGTPRRRDQNEGRMKKYEEMLKKYVENMKTYEGITLPYMDSGT